MKLELDKRPKDLPRDELIRRAQEVVDRSKGSAKVFFKFTCEHCGERCTFQDANRLWERGECHVCGMETVVERGGFLVMFTTAEAGSEHGS